ncbi:glycosyltransferase family 2 protein [Methylogaea oryzae]|uniref:glycosyltransferase family 2 protein n=1 Tax=Methylogaea oryzae TaxID=1295382 RepID=UPI0006D206A9|nr:glycosyltransferase family 2 protein [Methylogaea oryzae]
MPAVSSILLALSLGVLTIGFVYLGQVRLSLDEQLLLGWGLIGVMMLLNAIKSMKTPLGRIIFLSLTLFVYLRYMSWRTTDTLFFLGPLDFAGMALVYVAELQVGGVSLLNMFVNLWPLNRPIAPLPPDESLYPSIDIFIPTYNEPEDIVRVTATAATQIDYPKDKLKIYILDDGGTEQRRSHLVHGAAAWQRFRNLNALADSLGIGYLTRARNEHAKAGNINSAMRHTNSELILILDCDHVPTVDILRNTVGLFLKDPNLFLVQTPHFFVNPDPIERNLGSFGRAPSENEMFYRGAHPAMDLWNASFFCGSAALLKRSALEEVGGVCGETITEDAETALTLHSKGYNSAFIDRPMVCGLSPDTFGDFIVQRSRWCQGMLQICFLKNPVKNRGLSLPQKICYTSVYFFWFFGFSRFIFFVAPTMFILFGLQVYNASSDQVLAYAAPNLVASLSPATTCSAVFAGPSTRNSTKASRPFSWCRPSPGWSTRQDAPLSSSPPRGRPWTKTSSAPWPGRSTSCSASCWPPCRYSSSSGSNIPRFATP